MSDYIRSRSDAKPISLTFTKLEKALLERPWQAVREGVDVKLLPQEGELYVLARSSARVDKERAMRRRKLKWLMARLRELAAMKLAREELLMKLGAARTKARAAWRLVDVEVDPRIAAFSYALNRENSAKCDGAKAVICCAPIFADASRRSCGDSIPSSQAGPAAAPDPPSIDRARRGPHLRRLPRHCLHVTLRARLKPLATGLTPKAVLDKLAAVQMLDVHFPTTNGRTLILSRYTELNADQKILVRQLNLELPPQPPPRITAAGRLAKASADAV